MEQFSGDPPLGEGLGGGNPCAGQHCVSLVPRRTERHADRSSRNRGDGAEPARWGVRRASPADFAGANTQTLQIYVDDVDAHCARARAEGATIVEEPFIADHGENYWADKSYGALDPEGHLWWISERVRG